MPAGGLTDVAPKAYSPTSLPRFEALTLGTVSEPDAVAVACEESSTGHEGSTPVNAPMPPAAGAGPDRVTV
jgi:hypothetical protein